MPRLLVIACRSGRDNHERRADVAALMRRITLLEEDTRGEKLVARHTLRKVTANENILLDVKKEVTELRNELALLPRGHARHHRQCHRSAASRPASQ